MALYDLTEWSEIVLPFSPQQKFLLYPKGDENDKYKIRTTGHAIQAFFDGSNATKLQYLTKAYEKAFNEKPKSHVWSYLHIPAFPYCGHFELHATTYALHAEHCVHWGNLEEFHAHLYVNETHQDKTIITIEASSERAITLTTTAIDMFQEKLEEFIRKKE